MIVIIHKGFSGKINNAK